ncbi:MAG: radical SAM protein [Patescibacteria group bacterium]|nr:radical SAM protein [Patescibacteria group bacterium]
MKYCIKTFGCQQNVADSERISAAFNARGMTPTESYEDANYVIINTCMIRQKAEDRVYGLVRNLAEIKKRKLKHNELFKIIVTGCMVGVAFRDKTGAYFDKIRTLMPDVDEFMPIEEVGFDNEPVRKDRKHAWVPISNGCNNFCTFCIVPFTRGREISRPYTDIISECQRLRDEGYTSVMLLGQNVNSYGADLIVGESNIQVMRDIDKTYFQNTQKEIREYEVNGKVVKPVYVKHLGRQRIPTLFPALLADVARMGFTLVDFISSNPWDFSEELIQVIAQNQNISRTIHLPVQSGDSNVLKRMNRWYTAEEYIALTDRLKQQVPGIRFTTDIIVGFCGETEAEFENTVALCKRVGFLKAYIAMYSQRPMTAATKVFPDDVPHAEKKRRWQVLEDLINTPNLSNAAYKFHYSRPHA